MPGDQTMLTFTDFTLFFAERFFQAFVRAIQIVRQKQQWHKGWLR